MKPLLLFPCFVLLLNASACSQQPNNQNKKTPSSKVQVGGGCEGCEAIFESPIAFENLSNVDTLPDFNDVGQKIEISGIVYQHDGKTPAKDVVIYIYHTDQMGNYPPGKDAKGWEKRHGYIRGWVKTGSDGAYKFYTLRPAAYPSRQAPQHIHVTVKEPDKNEYWIDEFLFEDDPLLTKSDIAQNRGRGGNGVVKLVTGKDLAQAKRNIILGLNVPDYPKSSSHIMNAEGSSFYAMLRIF